MRRHGQRRGSASSAANRGENYRQQSVVCLRDLPPDYWLTRHRAGRDTAQGRGGDTGQQSNLALTAATVHCNARACRGEAVMNGHRLEEAVMIADVACVETCTVSQRHRRTAGCEPGHQCERDQCRDHGKQSTDSPTPPCHDRTMSLLNGDPVPNPRTNPRLGLVIGALSRTYSSRYSRRKMAPETR